MNTNTTQDEVIEELWKIKDQLSGSSKGNFDALIEQVNEIAKKKGFNNNLVRESGNEDGLTKLSI